jgi:acyl dehydratase
MTALKVGAELPSRSLTLTLDRMKALGGGNPIHFDPEFAKAQGLPAPIATGMITTGFLSELLIQAFGADWVRHGRMKNTYVKPVYLDETITAKAQVTRETREAQGTRLDLEVWVENQDGKRVTVGEESVVVTG